MSGKRMGLFERYLSVWVLACMIVGVCLGRFFPAAVHALRDIEFVAGSQVNAPIAVLIWLMIVPMMMRVDFASVKNVGRQPRGLAVTMAVNWLIKPFSMALIGWVFFRHVFGFWIGAAEADQYIAGVIILAAAPCTAMVFVWSYLTDGDPAYTLVQVALNDLLMLVLFAPIVKLLVSGAADLVVPFKVLLVSVAVFIVIPLAAGSGIRSWLIRRRGRDWFEQNFLPCLAPLTVGALLCTLVLIFAFQAENIMGKSFHVFLIAVPILIQVYLNASIAYGLMRAARVPYSVAAPGALIGASNFFELAVAVAITLFGPESGAALATVVGVLVEVPVMLSVCGVCNRTRHWFDGPATVIFACVHNAGRSQMAAAFFNMHADPAKARAISAGTNPGERVHPEVVEAMREVGIDLSKSKPQHLMAELAADARLLITMGCGATCPVVPGLKRDDWPLEDPKGKPVGRVREIRDDIRDRARKLIETEGWGRTTRFWTIEWTSTGN